MSLAGQKRPTSTGPIGVPIRPNIGAGGDVSSVTLVMTDILGVKLSLGMVRGWGGDYMFQKRRGKFSPSSFLPPRLSSPWYGKGRARAWFRE